MLHTHLLSGAGTVGSLESGVPSRFSLIYSNKLKKEELLERPVRELNIWKDSFYHNRPTAFTLAGSDVFQLSRCVRRPGKRLPVLETVRAPQPPHVLRVPVPLRGSSLQRRQRQGAWLPQRIHSREYPIRREGTEENKHVIS